jgi:chaperonin GroES
MAASLRPLDNRVVVERLDSEEKSEGGIYLPENAQEAPAQGKVLHVGRGKLQSDGSIQPMEVKVGDTIVFGKYSGTEVKIDGKQVLVMREEDILAVLEG